MLPVAVQVAINTAAVRRALGLRTYGVHVSTNVIERTIEVFRASKVRWTLVGAQAVNCFTVPRVSKDFNFIVEGSRFNGVLNALRKEFGDLEEVDIGGATRLDAISVDLIASNSHPLFKEALRISMPVRGAEGWKTPDPETLIVLKFMAATSSWRRPEKRAQDTVDLRNIYTSIGRDGLDIDRMLELSKRVYPGANKELRGMLRRIDRGDPIEV